MLISQLRNLNIEVSEKIVKMLGVYGFKVQEGHFQTLEYLLKLIDSLHRDNMFIYQSDFGLLLPFPQNYDPLFISYYQHSHSKARNESWPQTAPYLFQLDINKVYQCIRITEELRLLKARMESQVAKVEVDRGVGARKLGLRYKEEKSSWGKDFSERFQGGRSQQIQPKLADAEK